MITESGNPSLQSAIHGVIFDMDGVLTDSEPLINAAAVAMFKEKGVTVTPEDFAPFVGTGEDRYLGGVAQKHGVVLDLAAAKRRTYEIYLALVPSRLNAFPGAVALVQRCRAAGLQVAVASSADRIKIDANLAKIGLPADNWTAVVAGEDVRLKKPAPDIFLAAADRLGLRPNECVVVEDAVHGIQAARSASMRCVAVAQTFAPEDLKEADLVRATIQEVGLEDLLGTPHRVAPSPNMATPPPVPETAILKPWGFWATMGLGAAIALAWMGMQGVVAAAFLVAMQAAGRGLKEADIASHGFLLALAAICSAPVAVLLSYLFAWVRVGKQAGPYLGFRPVSWRKLAKWTVVFLGFVFVSDLLTLTLNRPVVPDFMVQIYETAGFLPLFWLALVVAAPVAEETLFRGFLFEGLQASKVGAPGAMIITSLFWAAIHVQYDLYGIASIFVFGLLLGWVRLKTASVFATTWLHAVMNFIATLETAVTR